MTNDPKNPEQTLKVKGDIHQFTQITPRYVRLEGTEGESISQTISITVMEEYPFKISKIELKNGANIKYTLESTQKDKNKVYLLKVVNTKKDPGRYSDTIVLHTDSQVKKELHINVVGSIRSKEPPQPPSQTPVTPGAPNGASSETKPKRPVPAKTDS